MTHYLFFDTETTGNTENDFICQLAYKQDSEEFSELYKPSIPIPPEASAVHHITNNPNSSFITRIALNYLVNCRTTRSI